MTNGELFDRYASTRDVAVRNEIVAAVNNAAINGISVSEAWDTCVANCNAALQGAE